MMYIMVERLFGLMTMWTLLIGLLRGAQPLSRPYLQSGRLLSCDHGLDRFRDQKLLVFDRENCYPGGMARLGRPRQYEERRATLTLRLDSDLKERAGVIAKDRHLSLNEYIVELLDRAVQRVERKESR
jgi:hypothetical protein